MRASDWAEIHQIAIEEINKRKVLGYSWLAAMLFVIGFVLYEGCRAVFG